MLNTTILACLLILTGCLGLGDDDVIDDAQGDDGHDDSGSTTVVNSFPQVQSMVDNGTITTSAGETLEIVEVWVEACNVGSTYCRWYATPSYDDTMVFYSFNCSTISSSPNMDYHDTFNSDQFLPTDGGSCEYNFWKGPYGDQDDDWSVNQFNILYRVWS